MEVPRRIAGKMTPFFTETEIEVAVILNELTELLRDPGDRPPDLCWGARRTRLAPRRRSPSAAAAAAIPEDDPSPSTSLPRRPHLDDDDDETKRDAAAAAAAAGGSPSSPLSFPASGGEEPKSRPPPPPPPPQNTPATKPSSKNSKHPNERIKELRNTIASSSAERDNLQREVEQYKTYCNTLKSQNSLLREQISKLLEKASPEPSTVGAPPTDSSAERRQRSPAKRQAEFDLNMLPEELEAAAEAAAAELEAAAAAAAAEAAAAAAAAELEAAAAAAAAAAEAAAAAAAAELEAAAAARSANMSAEARRRRKEIQRAKSIAAAAATAPGSMPWTAHKMPRLR